MNIKPGANAILVYLEDGTVKHRFCPAPEARTYLEGVKQRMEGGCMFAVDHPDAEQILSI